MSQIFADRVVDTTATTGTGALTLDDADINGYRSVGDVCANGDTIYLTVAHRLLPQWESAKYTYGAGTGVLTRTTILASSNAGSAVNFSAGTKDIVGGLPASVLSSALTSITEIYASRTISVKDAPYYAVGNNIADDTAAIQAAINYAAALPSGLSTVVYIPTGQYYVPGGLTIPSSVSVIGDGQNSTYLVGWHTDVAVVNLTGTKCRLENLYIAGKGINQDPGVFGATYATLTVAGVGNSINNVKAEGGYYPCVVSGTDNIFIDCVFTGAYGPANLHVTGASWFIRCSVDHGESGVTVTTGRPYPAWATGTPYVIGEAVTTGGYVLVCKKAGTSHATTAPTLKNYGVTITDGTAEWLLEIKASAAGVLLDGGALENHFSAGCDFSGNFTDSIKCNANGIILVCSDGVCSGRINVLLASAVYMLGNELGDDIAVDAGYIGRLIFSNNFTPGAGGDADITIGAGVTDFVITDNYLGGGTITTSGASDFYTITDNVRCTVVDGASGTNKTVTEEGVYSLTSIKMPTIFGGTAAGATLDLKATSHGTPSGDIARIWGSTIILRAAAGVATSVQIGVAGVTQGAVTMAGAASGAQIWKPAAAASGSITFPAGTVDFSATGGTSQVVKQTGAGGIFTVAQLAAADLSDVAALVTLTGSQELTNKTLTSSVGKGTWAASGTWTLPALTLGGVVSGGGQQLNNIIIGTVTPLAGTFTSLIGDSLRVNQVPTAIGTGVKTISNAADGTTNFGHYFSVNLNGTTYYIPCGATAPT